jgi:hypothetical protein
VDRLNRLTASHGVQRTHAGMNNIRRGPLMWSARRSLFLTTPTNASIAKPLARCRRRSPRFRPAMRMALCRQGDGARARMGLGAQGPHPRAFEAVTTLIAILIDRARTPQIL